MNIILIRDTLLNKVQEKGIVDIIYNYKKDLEFQDIIEKFYNDWELISCQRDLPLQFIIDNKDKLVMSLFSRFHRLTDEILEELKEYLIWDTVSYSRQLTQSQVDKYSDYII